MKNVSATPLLVPEQVANFIRIAKRPDQAWIGRAPATWVESLRIKFTGIANMSATPLSRAELIGLWRNGSISSEYCFLSTMAWGGMRVSNGRSIWNHKDQWMPICEKLRSGGFKNRKDAYEAFRRLRLEKKLLGMGPAYFTKLLFFARPVQDAYILDQWTARSIHLLTQNRVWPDVQVDAYTLKRMSGPNGSPKALRASVTDRVTSSDYEQFCNLVEEIGLTAGVNPCEIEESMFGQGGRNPSAWRSYVMDHWYLLQSGA